MSVLTEVLKLFKYDPATDGDMTFNIGQCMNDNWDKLDAAILLAIAAAGAYNPEESYAVGDYCTYKGRLRKCSTAIPTGETWTEAHWTTTTVAAELAELSSQLSNLNTLVGGATTPQRALANLGAGVRPSLVDNGIFVGPNLPVNQRGDTSWSTSGYHLDRWFFEQAAACSIADDGLHIGNEQIIIQEVDADTKDFFLGKTITVSALLSDGSFASATGVVAIDGNGILCQPKSGFYYGTFFFSDGSYQISRMFNNTGQEVTLVACKTEPGDTQTLAYQDEDGAWQLLPQPESDYATQLAKCQRYLAAMEEQTIVRSAYVLTNFVDFLVPIPVSFRVLPIIQSAEKLVLITQPDGAKVSGVTWSIATKSSASVRLRASKPNILSEGTDFSVYTDQGATFFSAEL